MGFDISIIIPYNWSWITCLTQRTNISLWASITKLLIIFFTYLRPYWIALYNIIRCCALSPVALPEKYCITHTLICRAWTFQAMRVYFFFVLLGHLISVFITQRICTRLTFVTSYNRSTWLVWWSLGLVQLFHIYLTSKAISKL